VTALLSALARVLFGWSQPTVDGRRALLVGFSEQEASFCHGYHLVGRITMPVDNEERRQPLARCTLDGNLAQVWPQILDTYR
jgi:hypothetical protein